MEDNKVLQGLVNYSSEGGGNISLKIEGFNKTYHTSNTVKEITLGDVEMTGNPEQIVEILKELLK